MAQTDRFLTIGEFAARTRLSPKALRLYDRSGLLRPHHIDAFSGYRRYSPAQVATGRLVHLLRSADFSLGAIESVLADLHSDTASESGADRARRRLDEMLAGIERDHQGRRVVIRYVQSLLREDTTAMFTISTRDVPVRRLLSIQRRLHGDQTDAFIAEAKAAFRTHLGETVPTGPFTVIFHGPVNEAQDGPIEVVLGVPEDVQASDEVGIRTEPAHTEAYTTITKAQWDYPAIMAAYDAVACSPEVAGRSRSPLSCREVYLAEPDEIGDDELICDVAYPLGDCASKGTINSGRLR